MTNKHIKYILNLIKVGSGIKTKLRYKSLIKMAKLKPENIKC